MPPAARAVIRHSEVPPRNHLRAVPADVPSTPPSVAPPVLVAVPPPSPEPNDADEHGTIPDPSTRFIQALAVRIFEVLEGTRTVQQLGPTISVGLARHLQTLRALRAERRAVTREHRREVPRGMGCRFGRPAPTAIEAAVVLHTAPRAVAVAIRLEWAHQHWRACEAIVL